MTTVDSYATQSCRYLMVRSRIVCSQKDLIVNHFLHAVLLTLAMAHHRVESDLVVAPVTTGHFILPFAGVVLCKVKSADSNIWWKSCHSLSKLAVLPPGNKNVSGQCLFVYLLTYLCPSLPVEHRPRPPAIALCSGLLLSFRTSWSLAVSALLQCLASNRCEAGLSSSSPAGSRSGLGMWCRMLASWGCVRSSPTSSAVSAWPLVPVPLAPTDLHFGSSLAIGFCRWFICLLVA